MPAQDQHAANAGDLLKHSLICEVLTKCKKEWTDAPITYAETHAGAGIYFSEGQKNQEKEKQHIEKLKQKYKNYNLNGTECPYFKALSSFWNVCENVGRYPGSAYLAASILNHGNLNFSLRLTEYEKPKKNDNEISTFTRLQHNLKNLLPAPWDFENESSIINKGFQEKIKWLTGNDNLVLIIDPFNLCVGKKGIADGKIDLFHLIKLLEHIKPKKNAVVGFWYADNRYTSALGLPDFFKKTIFENYGYKNVRHYYCKHYNMIWIGFGKGKNIVRELPIKDGKTKVWFGLKIKEKDASR